MPATSATVNEHSLERRSHLDTCTRVNANEEGGVANDDVDSSYFHVGRIDISRKKTKHYQ